MRKQHFSSMYVSILIQAGKLYTYNISVTLSFKYFLSKIKRRHTWGILKKHILLEQTTYIRYPNPLRLRLVPHIDSEWIKNVYIHWTEMWFFFHVLPHCVINVLISVMILPYYFIYLYLIHFNLCIPLYAFYHVCFYVLLLTSVAFEIF
jgi:hypothetical protein